jgi:transcriptional regulator with XRE-family HTH domain
VATLQNGCLPLLPDNAREIAPCLGRVIRRIREKKGLSQEDFAELTGHHRTYIGFLERGERSPNVETVQRIARALGLNASDLLKEAGF